MNAACLRRYASPLGVLTLASDGGALIGLWFDGQKHFMETYGADGKRVLLSPEGCREEALPAFAEAEAWLDCYFGGGIPDFTPPLRLCGTPFRQTAWRLLLEIPYGHTITYGELAERMGRARMSARAVGAAVGRNPVSLIVPCHRVVGADGNPVGYAAGTDTKTRLLALERANARK